MEQQHEHKSYFMVAINHVLRIPKLTNHGNMLKKLLSKFKRCSHEFATDNIKLTGIPLIPKPALDESYAEWQKYHEEFYECEGNIKRVSSVCRKCGKEFYANCGLDLPGHLVGASK